MILEISRNAEKITVELGNISGRRTVSLEGREVACDWVRLPDGQCSLILDGRVFDLEVEIVGARCHVQLRSERHELGISDPRRLNDGHRAEETLSGLQRICAEMPGKVIRVLVRPGDSVTVDQGLLVLEAMKMQNEIRAPKSGTVKDIAAISGNTVSTGDFLLSLE